MGRATVVGWEARQWAFSYARVMILVCVWGGVGGGLCVFSNYDKKPLEVLIRGVMQSN